MELAVAPWSRCFVLSSSEDKKEFIFVLVGPKSINIILIEKNL